MTPVVPAVRRLTALSTACLALVVAGCGSADEGKITSAQAGKLTNSLDAAQAAYEKGKCADARTAAAEGADKVSGLHGKVDDGLRQNLIDGFSHLEKELASNCDKPEETATPTSTATAEPTATEAPTETPSPTPEPTETATPSPEPTVTTEPTASPTPNDTGGADATVEP